MDAPVEEPSRLERMVGELIGLRLLVAKLLEIEGERQGPEFMDGVRGATIATIATWPIGSDTPEGAERIRRAANVMLTKFPASPYSP